MSQGPSEAFQTQLDVKLFRKFYQQISKGIITLSQINHIDHWETIYSLNQSNKEDFFFFFLSFFFFFFFFEVLKTFILYKNSQYYFRLRLMCWMSHLSKFGQSNLMKPMSFAYWRKHWWHILRPHFRIRPCRFEQTRLQREPWQNFLGWLQYSCW